MAALEIYREGKMVKFTAKEQERFIAMIDGFLQLGLEFIVSIAKSAEAAASEINKLFKKHGVKIEITADSDPDATEYFINVMVGTTLGAAGGAVAGAAFWAALKTWKAHIVADLVVPGIGQCIGIPAAIGAFIGAVSGMASTHYGLRIRFSPTNRRHVEVEMIPSST